MAPDYTGSAYKTWGQHFVWLVPPEVETCQQLIQFPHRQHDGFFRIGLGLEAFGLQTLEPQAKAIALPVEDLHPIAGLVEEDEQHRIEHGHLDIQLHQGRQTINGFPEVDRLWIEVDGFDLGVWTHHDGAPLGKREPSIRKRSVQVKVGFVERLPFTRAKTNPRHAWAYRGFGIEA